MRSKKNKNTRLKVLVIILIIVIIGTIGYYAYLFVTGEFSAQSSNTNNNQSEEIKSSEEKEKDIISYLGYNFKIPEDYQAAIIDNRLQLTGKEIAYIIAFDFKNNYEGYQAYFTTRYPEQITTLNNNISDRDYLIAVYQGSDNTYGVRFVSNTKDGKLFVGNVIKKDGVLPTIDDYKDLTTVLNNVEIDENSTKAEDISDSQEAYEFMPLSSTIAFLED